MTRALLFFVYNVLYPIFLLVSLPGFLIKNKRRGGTGKDISERFGRYRIPAPAEPKGGVYVHAVSVGEVFIALKWIRNLRAEHECPVILATSTATGLQIARAANIADLRVIFSPLDIPCIVRAVMRRFEPRVVVLIEAELWPNQGVVCRKLGIPMVMLNARLSPRSERRFAAIRPFTRVLFSYLSALGAQNEHDAERFVGIGVKREIIAVTGSIKFDVLGDTPPAPRRDFADILRRLAGTRPIVLACSTHTSEERLIAEAARAVGAFPLIVPRHMERRAEVVHDLRSAGFSPILRSSNAPLPENPPPNVCYVADTTGELREWTALSHVAVIGKSFLADGGQNPVEAIAARVPVVVGPHMSNFADLVSLLLSRDAILRCQPDELPATLKRIFDAPQESSARTERAYLTLSVHSGATQRSTQLVKPRLEGAR